ncbi:MAG: 2Fe-2S iron-sulfur cluster-binding protein [Spirochaetota bacterium]
MIVNFILNGEDVSLRARSGDRLIDILRDSFSLHGAKADCRKGTCGKCLVVMDGRLVPACMVLAFKVRGREIITIEGFVQTDEYKDVEEGIREVGLETCGFCDAGVILAIASAIEGQTRPGRAEIIDALSSVQCRCTDPETTLRAALAAADAKDRRLYARVRK